MIAIQAPLSWITCCVFRTTPASRCWCCLARYPVLCGTLACLIDKLGGIEEYHVCAALEQGRITKPLVAWCIGTCARMFTSEVLVGSVSSFHAVGAIWPRWSLCQRRARDGSCQKCGSSKCRYVCMIFFFAQLDSQARWFLRASTPWAMSFEQPTRRFATPVLSYNLFIFAAGYQWDYCAPTGAPGTPRSHRLQVGTGARADPKTGKLRLQHF